MHLWVDGQCLQTESRKRGIGRYVANLLAAMGKASREHTITISLNATLTEGLPYARTLLAQLLPMADIRFWEGAVTDGEATSGHGIERQVAEHCLAHHVATIRPDVALCTSPFEGAMGPAVPYSCCSSSEIPTAAIFYDLIPSRFPSQYLPTTSVKTCQQRREARLKQLPLLLAISQFAKREAKDFLSHSHVACIDAAVSDDFLERIHARRLSLTRSGAADKPSVLYVGGLDWRKNVLGVIDGFARLPETLRQTISFVCIGDAPEVLRQQLRELWASHGLPTDHLVLRPFVSDDELVDAYLSATLVFQPSLMEGFGLTALEALACGTPVIASNTGALPEVINDAGMLFDPSDPQDIARSITAALSNPSLCQRAIEHGFDRVQFYTWARSADLAWNALESLHTSRASSSVSRGIRIVSTETTKSQILADTMPMSCWLSEQSEVQWIAPTMKVSQDDESLWLIDQSVIRKKDGISSGPLWAGPVDIVLAGDNKCERGAQGEFFIGGKSGSDLTERLEQIRKMPLRLLRKKTLANLPTRLRKPEWGKYFASAESMRRRPVLHIDVSFISRTDPGTGIQRVVRHIAKELMLEPPTGWDVALCRCNDNDGFLPASEYAERIAGDCAAAPTRMIEARFCPGDVLLMLDSSWEYIQLQSPHLRRIRDLGCEVHFTVYDLIPVRYPAFCHSGLVPVFKNWLISALGLASGVICISRAVADDVLHLMESLGRSKTISVGYWPLGADFSSSTGAVPPSASTNTNRFLMVGTLEPRKGHSIALAAFEHLWQQGCPAELHIAGKQGWNVDHLMTTMKSHPERDHRLFLHDAPSDEELGALYRSASAIVAASYAEGFGLPIIEAQHLGKPVIASDIQVFREVAPNGTRFFKVGDPEDLAHCITEFLHSRPDDIDPMLADISPVTSWRESAAALADVLLGKSWYLQKDDHAPPICDAITAAVTAPLSEDNSRGCITLIEKPSRVAAQAGWQIVVRIDNLGQSVWSSIGDELGRFRVNIAYRPINADGHPLIAEAERVPIVLIVAPGQPYYARIDIADSSIPSDTVAIEIQMVQEAVAWWPVRLTVNLP